MKSLSAFLVVVVLSACASGSNRSRAHLAGLADDDFVWVEVANRSTASFRVNAAPDRSVLVGSSRLLSGETRCYRVVRSARAVTLGFVPQGAETFLATPALDPGAIGYQVVVNEQPTALLGWRAGKIVPAVISPDACAGERRRDLLKRR